MGWYEKSAQGGNIDAQKSLAKMKFEGEGWFPDQKSAVMWLTKAAEQGDAESKFHLGNIYFNGSSQIEQDYCEAHKWYESLISEDIAADGVSVKTYLGVMYEQGLCVPKDVKKAIELYKDAAELGDASARERLDFLNSPSGLIDDSAAIGIGSDTAAGQLCQQFYPAIKRVFELKQQDTPIEMTLRIIEGSYEYSPRLYQFLSRVAAEIYENPYRQVSFVNSGAYMTECINFVDGY